MFLNPRMDVNPGTDNSLIIEADKVEESLLNSQSGWYDCFEELVEAEICFAPIERWNSALEKYFKQDCSFCPQQALHDLRMAASNLGAYEEVKVFLDLVRARHSAYFPELGLVERFSGDQAHALAICVRNSSDEDLVARSFHFIFVNFVSNEKAMEFLTQEAQIVLAMEFTKQLLESEIPENYKLCLEILKAFDPAVISDCATSMRYYSLTYESSMNLNQFEAAVGEVDQCLETLSRFAKGETTYEGYRQVLLYRKQLALIGLKEFIQVEHIDQEIRSVITEPLEDVDDYKILTSFWRDSIIQFDRFNARQQAAETIDKVFELAKQLPVEIYLGDSGLLDPIAQYGLMLAGYNDQERVSTCLELLNTNYEYLSMFAIGVLQLLSALQAPVSEPRHFEFLERARLCFYNVELWNDYFLTVRIQADSLVKEERYQEAYDLIIQELRGEPDARRYLSENLDVKTTILTAAYQIFVLHEVEHQDQYQSIDPVEILHLYHCLPDYLDNPGYWELRYLRVYQLECQQARYGTVDIPENYDLIREFEDLSNYYTQLDRAGYERRYYLACDVEALLESMDSDPNDIASVREEKQFLEDRLPDRDREED